MEHSVLSAFAVAALSGTLPAQTFLPRSDHMAGLEPAGRVMNGAGPSTDAFQNYWNVMKPGEKAIVSMYYVNLRGVQTTIFSRIPTAITLAPGPQTSRQTHKQPFS